MNSRERVLTTLSHKRADRVPLDMWCRPEVLEGLKRHYDVDDEEEIYRKLGLDIRGAGIHVSKPGFTPTGRLDSESPGAGRRYILHDERTFENEWGVVQRVGTDGKYDEWVSGPLVEAFDLARVPFADAEFEDVASIREKIKPLQEEYFVLSGITMPFKWGWQLRGIEQFLTDFFLEGEKLHGLLDIVYAFETEKGKRLARAGTDCISVVGDIAMQNQLFIPPAKWREFCKPRLAKLLEEIRAVRKDIYFFIHSDGNILEILDDIVEIGFDIINPVQPECMDPVVVKKRYGDRITIHGAFSLQKTLPFGSEDDVRKEVRYLVDSLAYNGGFIMMPSNVIGFDVPVKNVVALYEEAKDYTR